jgi:MFS family permease
MMNESENQFNKLIEKRKARGKKAGGEVFAYWGILNLIAFFLFSYLWGSLYVWVIMIVLGIILQIIYVRRLQADQEYKLFWFGTINQLWIFMVVLMPFIFYVFPFLLNVYSPINIYPLLFLWLSIGMFISGILVGQLCFKLGGIIFLISCIVTVLFFDMLRVIYPVTMILGLVLPGIWSRYEEEY